MNTSRIGYLIPEFPGQTHNFFWRERQALQELGIDTRLISTRRPPKGIVSTSWARAGEAETAYLYPLSMVEAVNALVMLLTAGPMAWYRCVSAVIKAGDLSFWKRLRLSALIPFAAKLACLAREQGWHHVHVHSCADAANIAMFAALLSECTYSLTLHGSLAGYGPNQEQKWAHSAFAIFVTHTLCDEVSKSVGRHLPGRLEVAPMGVDVEKFSRASPYAPYAGVGELALFSCGRLNQGKGHAFLIEAIVMLRRQGIRVKLDIAGEDEQGGTGYRKQLERLIAAEGLDGVVSLLGAVSEETVRARLERAHLFVLASLDEALGVVLMEAMAMSVPVIATKVGGVPELVEDGEDGILVPSGDAEAIAGAIRGLAADPGLALRLASASRRKIVDSFSHRRSAEAIARLLKGGQADALRECAA